MGAVSPPPFVSEELMSKVIKQVVEPTVNGLHSENIAYKGVVFIGLIRVNNEPYVIEYNCRFGDPETEVILPRIDSDLLELFKSLYTGDLSSQELKISEKQAATIMLVSGGYPEAYKKGKQMSIPLEGDSMFFHAGTKEIDNKIVTNGGRVLAITSIDNSFKDAISKSMLEAEKINFEGKNYRKDIGFDL
jgi:phosphoribosylamine--glycine ligase